MQAEVEDITKSHEPLEPPSSGMILSSFGTGGGAFIRLLGLLVTTDREHLQPKSDCAFFPTQKREVHKAGHEQLFNYSEYSAAMRFWAI